MSAGESLQEGDEGSPLVSNTPKHKQVKATDKPDVQLKKVFNELAEEMKCALCLELFEKPLLLPCLHTFCAHCLKELVNNTNIICPLCRARHELDTRGIDGLRINYHLLNITEKMRSANLRCCAECQGGPVVEYCNQCKAYLCGPCGSKIHALRLMRIHVRRSLDPSDSLTMDDLDIELDELKSSSSGSSSPPSPTASPSPSPAPSPSPSPSLTMMSERQPTGVVQADDIVVNFVIRRDRCVENFLRWVKNLWFMPSDFHSTYRIRQVKPLLVPFWLFEVETQSNYTAMVGMRVGVGGVGMSGAKDSCSTILGENSGRYRIAVVATDTLDPSILVKIEPWELEDIRPPPPPSDVASSSGDESDMRMLGGIPRSQVVAATIDSPSAYQRGGDTDNVEAKAMRLAAEQVERIVKERVGGINSIRNVRLRTEVTRVAAQRVFMPVWMIKYMYNNQRYVVLENGQHGQLYGDRPYSMGKITSFSLTGLGAIMGIFAKTSR